MINDPFNPRWYSEEPLNKTDYDKYEIDLLNQNIKNYIEKSKEKKSFLDYCNNNSAIIDTIRNFNPDFNDSY